MTQEPRVLGLDLSITSTGVCRPDGTTFLIVPKKVTGDARINFIRDAVRGELTGVDVAVVEDFPAMLQAAAAKAIGIVQGAVRSALMDAGVPYAVVPPSTLKKYATDNGSCSKTDMALAAYKRGAVEFEKDPNGDRCDAWWLFVAGLDRYAAHPPLGGLPKGQRAALDKVDWPEPRPRPDDGMTEQEVREDAGFGLPVCPACEGDPFADHLEGCGA